MEASSDETIKNRLSTTVVFPDGDLPEPVHGGFNSQDDFRRYILKHQNGQWNATFIARPTPEHVADYNDKFIAQAFPKHFPYGFSGLPSDPAVIGLSELEKRNNRSHMKRKWLDVLKKYLRHQQPHFHEAEFVLTVQNLIMKDSIFNSARMHCSIAHGQSGRMSEAYGNMTAEQLESAIQDARYNSGKQYSMNPENHYLRSIRASCQSLPHTIESANFHRTHYFSYLSRFGMPAIFLTVTPDDQNSFRVLVYGLKKNDKRLRGTSVDVSKLTSKDLLAGFNLCQETRQKYPGLCAEEYRRIIDAVVKNVFAWDVKTHKKTGMGLFGETLAWCLVTEEQGRKTLHGHMLLFIKDWNFVSRMLQRGKGCKAFAFSEAVRRANAFFRNACSAKLLPDADNESTDIFEHTCKAERSGKKRKRTTVHPVPDQSLRDMRHKQKCIEHNGIIAKCNKCDCNFSIEKLVCKAVQSQVGFAESFNGFPDYTNRLSRHVFEQMKDFSWTRGTRKKQNSRYVAANALSNVHLVCHTNRCFKKGCECYANLAEQVFDKAKLVFSAGDVEWHDCFGEAESRHMFRFYPKRDIEDAFMNTHNKMLTELVGSNTNVMVGMTGQCVFYVTCYNCKSTQKEELQQFQKVAEIILERIKSQVSCNTLPLDHRWMPFLTSLEISFSAELIC